MSLTIRSAPSYALTQSLPNVQLRQVIAYALVDPRPELPSGKSGAELVKEMILALTTHSFPEGSMQIDPPATSADPKGNSTVLVTALDGSQLTGSMTFFYRRLPIDEALGERIPQGSIVPTNYANSHAMLADLIALTGIELRPNDIENLPVSGGSVTIRAASSSYFFVPGSEFILS